VQEALGDASNQQAADCGVAAGAHDDQVSADVSREIGDVLARLELTEEMVRYLTEIDHHDTTRR